MSSRSLAGILFLLAALLLPWLFRDWLPAQAEPVVKRSEFVSVPGADAPRERRVFSEIDASRRVTPSAKPHKRNPPRGSAKAFTTGAKAFLSKATRSRDTLENEATDRHLDRLQTEMERLGMKMGDPVFCRTFKEEKELELWLLPSGRSEYSLFRVYPIIKWSGKTGPKTNEGDHQVLEGFYYVSSSRMIPQSKYHMGFDLGYPNEYDRLHGRSGSKVMIHGKSMSHGSYAMGDKNIEEVYTITAAALNAGQPFFRVHCFPFRMEDKVMDPKLIGRGEVEAFWANLKEGYDSFEIMRRPPDVTISPRGNYYFSR